MPAELSLAIVAAVVETGRLVIDIGHKIKEVHDNRAQKRCERLATEAKMLTTLLDARSNNVTSEIIHDAQNRVKDISSYIDSIANSTFVDDVKEVTWTKRYLVILSDIARVKDEFLIELLSRTAIAPLSGSRPQATFKLANPSVIRFTDQQENIGFGTSEPIDKFVCYKFENSKLSLESLRMYPRLQDRAYVQRFKGLADVKGQLYVFMEDCSRWQTLNALYNRKEGGPKGLVSRVELALKIAQTIAWYHQSDVILKAIYDHYIALKEEDSGHWTPILTGLDHMRNLYERMSGFRFDCRYEAPEFHAMGQHTLFTDIWSLGTIAWQIICARFPFDIPTPVDSTDDSNGNRGTNRDSIRDLLARNEDPGEFPEHVPRSLADGLRKCWNRDALSRPNARQVAVMLQETWVRLLQNKDENLPLPQHNLAGSIDDFVDQAKDRARSLLNDQRARHNNKQQADKPLGKMDIHHTRALMEAEGAFGGECAFLLGASVWWKRLDEESYSFIFEMANIGYISEDENCKRAELALAFLQKAARSGNKDCYLELSKAYATLRRYYDQKYTDLGLQAQTSYRPESSA